MADKRLKNLENRVSELLEDNEDLRRRVEELEVEFDLSPEIESKIRKIFRKEFRMDGGGIIKIGDAFFSGISPFDGVVNRAHMNAGEDDEMRLSSQSDNSQLTLENQPTTTGSTNQSFFYGFRAPLYTNTGVSITSSESTLSDTKFQWDTNELQGAYVTVLDSSGVLQDSFEISSNTATEITVDGTWGFTDSDSTYTVFMPVYLGSADYPWRRLYAGEDMRLGFGASNSTDVQHIKWGSGDPNGSVSAPPGSIYFRKDGGTDSTVLTDGETISVKEIIYVKMSGTGNSNWELLVDVST